MNKEAARHGDGDDDGDNDDGDCGDGDCGDEDEVVDSRERRRQWQKCRGRPADRLDLLTGKSSRSRSLSRRRVVVVVVVVESRSVRLTSPPPARPVCPSAGAPATEKERHMGRRRRRDREGMNTGSCFVFARNP